MMESESASKKLSEMAKGRQQFYHKDQLVY